MLCTSSPPLPLGRSRVSTSYSRPAAECTVSRCTSRCTSRRKNTLLSTTAGPAVVLEFAGRIVQEHEVEIGAVAELDAAELAVGDDDHPGLRESASSAGP